MSEIFKPEDDAKRGSSMFMRHPNSVNTADDQHVVRAPTAMLENIKALFSVMDPASRQMLNCRKSALVAAGILPLEVAIDTTLKSLEEIRTNGYDLDEALELGLQDRDGILPMLHDVDRILRAGNPPRLWTVEDEKLSKHFDSDSVFPQIVHIFECSAEKALSLTTQVLTSSLGV